MKKNRWYSTIINGIILSFITFGCAQGSQTGKASPPTADKPTIVGKRTASSENSSANAGAMNQTGLTETKTNSTSVCPITADKKELVFNDLYPADKVNGSFIITNQSKETVEIVNPIRKSCGCLADIKLENYKLEPGQSTKLSLVYTASNAPGEYNRKLFLDTKSPPPPQTLELLIKSNVKPIVDFNPEQLEFELRASPKNTMKLTVQSTDQQEFSITKIDPGDDIIQITCEPQAKSIVHKLTITNLNFDRLRNYRDGVIIINTDHPRAKIVSIPFKVIMPFEVYPRSKTFFNAKPGEQLTAKIKVISNYGEALVLGNVHSQKGFVKILDTQKTDDGYQLEISMNVPAQTDKPYINDILLIEIKDHPQDTLKLSCFARIKK